MTAPRAAVLVLWALTAFWGLTFVLVKDALSAADTWTFLALRFGLAVFVGAAATRGRGFSPRVWKVGLKLGALLFVGFALQTYGLSLTTPSRSAFITGMCVVLVPLVARLLFGRVLSWAYWGAALSSAAGLALLTQIWVTGAVGVGDWATAGCAVAFAFHILGIERWTRDVPVLPLVTVQCLVVALGSWALRHVLPTHFDPTASFWWSVVALAILASVAAISLQTWAQRQTSAVYAALVFSLEPVFAALFSSALGRETLAWNTWVGGSIIVLAVAGGEWAAFRDRPRQLK